LIGASLTERTIERAALAAASSARPLAQNGYKVELVQGLVRRALRILSWPVRGADACPPLQLDRKDGAARLVSLHRDPASVRLDDHFAEREPQSDLRAPVPRQVRYLELPE